MCGCVAGVKISYECPRGCSSNSPATAAHHCSLISLESAVPERSYPLVHWYVYFEQLDNFGPDALFWTLHCLGPIHTDSQSAVRCASQTEPITKEEGLDNSIINSFYSNICMMSVCCFLIINSMWIAIVQKRGLVEYSLKWWWRILSCHVPLSCEVYNAKILY